MLVGLIKTGMAFMTKYIEPRNKAVAWLNVYLCNIK